MSVLEASRPSTDLSDQGPWSRGSVIVSDTHFGDLANGQAQSVVAMTRDAVSFAIDRNVGLIFDGDTFDYYTYSSDEKRMDDSSILRETLLNLAEAGLPIAFLNGNHDPRMTAGDIERYTLLSPGQYTLEGDFFMPSPEYLVTHGHKVQLLNISKLTKRFHRQLTEEFGEDWQERSPDDALQARVLSLLSGDVELQKECDRIDAYYQNGIDHPEKRWRTKCFHSLAMFFQSSRGFLSAGLSRLAKDLSAADGPVFQKKLLQWLASGCRLGLTHRALRFAKSLNVPMIICGHNHVPQVEEEELRNAHGTSTHLYANAGSAYQRGQSNTLLYVERSGTQTAVHLMSHQPDKPGSFVSVDRGVYDREKRMVTT